MAWEENSRICLHMQLIAILSRTGVKDERRIFEQLLDAVEFGNDEQVVHRVLILENVMITRNGENVKLIDFGLADTDCYIVFKQPTNIT